MLIIKGWLFLLAHGQIIQFIEFELIGQRRLFGQRNRFWGSGTMNDDLMGLVCQAVFDFEGKYQRDKLWRLGVLVGHVRDAVPSVADVDEDELAIMAAMCWLGPSRDGIPPASLRNELLGIVRDHVPAADKRLNRILEFAIAYGCGKWRQVLPDHGTWRQRWPEASGDLARRAILPAVKDANRWMANKIRPGFPSRAPDDLWKDAVLLRERLLTTASTPLEDPAMVTVRIACDSDGAYIAAGRYRSDVPIGSKYVFQVTGHATLRQAKKPEVRWPAGTMAIVLARDDDVWVEPKELERVPLNQGETADLLVAAKDFVVWECACGHVDCENCHRLESWDPRVTLWSFVASAVKGPGKKKRNRMPIGSLAAKSPKVAIQTGGFPQGMYFELLAKEGIVTGRDKLRLRKVPVELRICPCGKDERGYEGDQCPACRADFKPWETRKIALERLIVVGMDPGLYVRAARLKCVNRAAHSATYNVEPPRGKHSKKWVNLYDIDDIRSLEDLREIDASRNHTERLAAVARKKNQSVRQLCAHLNGRRKELKSRIQNKTCPLCGGKPTGRPFYAWIRNFAHEKDVEGSESDTTLDGADDQDQNDDED